MAGSQGAINHARPVAYEHHRQVFVANIELDLFVDPDRNERRQPIDDRPQTGLGQAGRHADHVLLGHAGIDELPRTLAAQLVEQRVAMVACEQ